MLKGWPQKERAVSNDDRKAFHMLIERSFIGHQYTDEELDAWIDLHHKGYDLLSLARLFADVHWCPKDRGGVRP